MTDFLPNASEGVVAGQPMSRAWYTALSNALRTLNRKSDELAAQQGQIETVLDSLQDEDGNLIDVDAAIADKQDHSPVLDSIAALAGPGLVARVAGGWLARTIQPVDGETTVTDGDGLLDDPAIGLADVADAGGGTLQKTDFDAKGRKIGTSAATTDDLTEGITNLYFTDERAQDAIGAAIAAGVGDGATLDYDDTDNTLGVTNTDKGSVAVAAHEAASDPHPQYLTAAEASAAYVDTTSTQSITGPKTILDTDLTIQRVNSTATNGAAANLRRARAGNTAVQSGDILGRFLFWGHDGSAYQPAAAIVSTAAETYTGSVRGTEFRFETTAIGSTTRTARWAFKAAGHLEALADNVYNFCSATNRAANGYIVNLRPGAGTVIWTSGSGTPEGSIVAPIGSLYTRTDGGAGTTLYVKESGAGNTGWVAK